MAPSNSAAADSSRDQLRRRPAAAANQQSHRVQALSSSSLGSTKDTAAAVPQKKEKPQWLFWALSSGAFAACNGVFAKLTTAGRTEDLALFLARSVTGSVENEPVFEIVARAVFFGMNLLSNAIMWFLFTRALTAATSTTRVSILNTSANFLVTAVLGMFIFGEQLPVSWWLGAAMLVAGSVIIGAREDKESEAAAVSTPSDGQTRVRLSADTASSGAGVGSQNAAPEPYQDHPIQATATTEPAELRS